MLSTRLFLRLWHSRQGPHAATITGAGGLCLIGGGYGDAEWLEREFAEARNVRVGLRLYYLVTSQASAVARFSANTCSGGSNAVVRLANAIRSTYQRCRRQTDLPSSMYGPRARSCRRWSRHNRPSQGAEAGGHGLVRANPYIGARSRRLPHQRRVGDGPRSSRRHCRWPRTGSGADARGGWGADRFTLLGEY